MKRPLTKQPSSYVLDGNEERSKPICKIVPYLQGKRNIQSSIFRGPCRNYNITNTIVKTEEKNDMKYKKPSMEIYEFETEDVITSSNKEVSVPTGITQALTDVVTPDPWGEDE